MPVIFVEESPRDVLRIIPNKSSYELQDRRAIIDVGSIGRPRTPLKKACLVIYDEETKSVRFKRFAIQ
jgi:hypothetical protein